MVHFSLETRMLSPSISGECQSDSGNEGCDFPGYLLQLINRIKLSLAYDEGITITSQINFFPGRNFNNNENPLPAFGGTSDTAMCGIIVRGGGY